MTKKMLVKTESVDMTGGGGGEVLGVRRGGGGEGELVQRNGM